MTSAALRHPATRALMLVPLPGLLIGAGIVFIAGVMPTIVTFGIVWTVIFCAAPLSLLAQVAGAGSASAYFGFGALLLLHLVVFHAPLVGGLVARNRLLTATGLNTAVVGWSLLLGGWVAVQCLGDAWPG
ncbi:MAG TPA: hypothetical protein VGR32_01705 [Brevundimonas sp.]|uniref:hypothetical protein n=1 Tax=Brevundimonas sp. TaxID=1871086 RepID=UPI002DF33EBB|nr:hypothetical protein [Brevundimonas sp.]